MFHYAEEGIECADYYGDINEQFYNNIFKAYANALEHVSNNNIEEKYRKRALKMMETGKGCGWGFAEALADYYYNYYDSDDEEE
jgi:hypothetical protein